MWKSPIFGAWYAVMMCLWLALFSRLDSVAFFLSHWYYAAMMVLGAFVAGFTPEGAARSRSPCSTCSCTWDRRWPATSA